MLDVNGNAMTHIGTNTLDNISNCDYTWWNPPNYAPLIPLYPAPTWVQPLPQVSITYPVYLTDPKLKEEIAGLKEEIGKLRRELKRNRKED